MGVALEISGACSRGGAMGLAMALMIIAGIAAEGAVAQEAAAPRWEIASGFDATAHAQFVNASLVYAFNRDLHAQGWRVRAAAGRGQYDYDASISGGTVPVDGEARLAEVLLGYQWRRGALFLKGYVGASYADHELKPGDPNNAVDGSKAGFKAAVEIWRDLGSRAWLSADASYATAFEDYWSQLRVGRRIGGGSIGLEGGAMGNAEYDAGRAGGFYRFGLGAFEVTASAGVGGDYVEQDLSGYLSLNIGRKF